MSETIYLLTICLPLATVLIVFGMRYYSTVQQAKLRYAQDEEYRRLAAQSSTSQTEAVAALAVINEGVAELKARLSAIEKILREVE